MDPDERADMKPSEQHPISQGDLPIDVKEDESEMHQNSPTDKSSFELRPRFDADRLRNQLKEETDVEKRMPYAYFEVLLCECLGKARSAGWDEDVNLKALQLHHLLELRPYKDELTADEALNYETQFNEMRAIHPQIEKQYELIKDLLHIASGLAVKYGVFSRDNYNYRCAGRCVCVHVLDLEKFNSDVYTIDLLWFTNAVYMEPFESVIEDCVREFGKVLMKSAIDLFACMLNMNEEVPDIMAIKGMLSRRSQELQELGWLPDENITRIPEYAHLDVPGNFILRFIKLKRYRKLGSLVRLLREFDTVYKQFEKALIANFIVITNAKKNILDASIMQVK